MPNFLETIFSQLQRSADRVVLREVRGEKIVSVTGRELLKRVQRARSFLRASGIQPGDRCALLGANSTSWIVCDLALMAENIIVVPLYSRQAASDLVGMLKDCNPRLLLTGTTRLVLPWRLFGPMRRLACPSMKQFVAREVRSKWILRRFLATTRILSPLFIRPAPLANPKGFALPRAISLT
jgi:long-subunit acyl-CoA synthetase (AMP-forming)